MIRVCPTCGKPAAKVIYMAMPMHLCDAHDAPVLFGFWSWLMCLLPFTGWFVQYEGGYLQGLRAWLSADGDEDED